MFPPNLEEVTSVCTTPQELIASADFIRGLKIILGQVDAFNPDYILSLFKKLERYEVLNEDEKAELFKFLGDERVAKKGQDLLSKLKNVRVNVKTDNTCEMLKFSHFLNEILEEDGYKKVSKYVGVVAKRTKLALNAYEGFTRLQIQVNGEIREIYLENNNLRVDSSTWEEGKIGGIRVKINPERDITEYLEGELAGQQLFSYEAAIIEAQKLGKRLPFIHDENPEFQAIIEQIGAEELVKIFPGWRNIDGSAFGFREDRASFWSASIGKGAIYSLNFANGISDGFIDLVHRSYGLSVRCVKD